MKKVVYSNYRVEVEPESISPWMLAEPDGQHKQQLEILNQLAKAIRRHLDIKDVSVMCDRTEVCSFCKSLWEDEVLCCDKGIEEANAKEGK